MSAGEARGCASIFCARFMPVNWFVRCLSPHCSVSSIDAVICTDIEKAICEKFVSSWARVPWPRRLVCRSGLSRSVPPSRRLLVEIMQEVVAAGRAKVLQLTPDMRRTG